MAIFKRHLDKYMDQKVVNIYHFNAGKWDQHKYASVSMNEGGYYSMILNNNLKVHGK